MESPRKFNDCYFYYYSTCTKGDNCVFRHEPSALGCETMCAAWQQGKCLDKSCKLRHMELRKNRKQIPCYWENQPGGCRKKHCPFMHKHPEARTDGIAPSQPAPIVSAQATLPEDTGAMNPTVPVPTVSAQAPAPTQVPLLWQQQRQQVVLDSAILGVLPTNELLPRRVVPHAHAHAHAHPHAHAHAHAHSHSHSHEPYAPLPVDPLVVNFEEESDNESAPSSTPTKNVSPEEQVKLDAKSQELVLLEKIQAEAAAFYSYDNLPQELPKERKVVRTNLTTKYDKLSLDEIAGKKQSAEVRSCLDFKVLSLDEIRARKRVSEAIIKSTPITLNLNRKRKLSTHETMTTSGNKIIKMVRSNSIVYKKLDKDAPAQNNQAKIEQKRNADVSRKRTLSEISDIYDDIHENELVDNCFEFKRIKIAEIPKPRLVRNRSATKSISESKDDDNINKNDDDSDNEVQFVSIELESNISKIDDDDIIDLESTKMSDPVDIVDLCEDQDEISVSELDLDLGKNVPDVVASCQKNNKTDKDLLNDIDDFLNEEL